MSVKARRSAVGRVSPEISRLVDEGVRAFNAGNAAAAVKSFDAALERRPPDAAAVRLFRGQALRALGRDDAARRDALAAAKLAPSALGVRLAAVELLSACGAPRQAGEEALACAALDASAWEAPAVRAALGRVLVGQKPSGLAARARSLLRRCEAALRRSPAAAGYALRAQLETALGRREAALLSWREAARLPGCPESVRRDAAAALAEAEGEASSSPKPRGKAAAGRLRVLAVGRVGAEASKDVSAGARAFNRGDAKEALARFDAALARKPDDPSAHLFRAQALRSLSRGPEAREAVLAAVRAAPDAAGVRLAAAEALRSVGAPGEALEHCWACLRLDASAWSAPAVRAALGEAMAGGDVVGRARVVLAGCEAALRVTPAAEGFAFRAELESALGLSGKALESWRAAARARDASGGVLLKAAQAHAEAGQGRDAVELASRAVKKDPKAAAAWEILAECSARLGLKDSLRAGLNGLMRLKPKDPAVVLKAAGLFREAGEPEKALREGLRAAELGAGARALESAAIDAARLGKKSLALELLEKACKLEPAYASARLPLALALAELGRDEEALAHCRRALELDPKRAEACALAARLEDRLGRPAEALSLLEKGAALGGWTPDLRLQAAAALERLDRPAEALAHCDRAKAQAPSLAEARTRAAAELCLGGRAGALNASREAAKLFSDDAEALLWAADVARRLGRFDESLAHLRAATKAAPKRADGWLALGRLELWHARPQDALARAARALELDRGSAAALSLRGAALSYAGKLKEALPELEAAARRDREDFEAEIWRAETLRRMGRPGPAASVLEGLYVRAENKPVPIGALINLILARAALGKESAKGDWDRVFDGIPWRQIGIRVGSRWPSTEVLEELLTAMQGNRGILMTFTWKRDEGMKDRPIHLQTRVSMMDLQAGMRFGDVARVLAEFDLLAEEDPEEPYTWASRGEVCFWAGRYADARAGVAKAEELNPDLPWPQVGFVAYHLLSGELDEAEARLVRASRNGASAMATAAWRGELLRRRGRPREALELMLKSTPRAPFRPGLWANIGLAQAELGLEKDAARTLSKLESGLPAFVADARLQAKGRAPRAVLAEMLGMLKGNRSSWMYCYVRRDGSLGHARVAGVPAAEIPSGFRGNPWMFER